MKKAINIAILVLISIILISSLHIFEIENAQANDNILLKNEDQIEFPQPDISGKIDSYAFSRSIPNQMTIGRSYKFLVVVKNTGKSRSTFRILLFAPNEFFYPQYDAEIVELDKGEAYRTEFLITPTKEHIGELNITLKLYLFNSSQKTSPKFILVDSVYKSVHVINRGFSTQYIMTIIVSLLGIISVIRIIKSFALIK